MMVRQREPSTINTSRGFSDALALVLLGTRATQRRRCRWRRRWRRLLLHSYRIRCTNVRRVHTDLSARTSTACLTLRAHRTKVVVLRTKAAVVVYVVVHKHKNDSLRSLRFAYICLHAKLHNHWTSWCTSEDYMNIFMNLLLQYTICTVFLRHNSVHESASALFSDAFNNYAVMSSSDVVKVKPVKCSSKMQLIREFAR